MNSDGDYREAKCDFWLSSGMTSLFSGEKLGAVFDRARPFRCCYGQIRTIFLFISLYNAGYIISSPGSIHTNKYNESQVEKRESYAVTDNRHLRLFQKTDGFLSKTLSDVVLHLFPLCFHQLTLSMKKIAL